MTDLVHYAVVDRVAILTIADGSSDQKSDSDWTFVV